jgi:hypothetical protein
METAGGESHGEEHDGKEAMEIHGNLDQMAGAKHN